MAFFKTDPNLPANEKARIEFRMQQIAECIGFDRFQLPVLSMNSLRGLYESNLTLQQIVDFLGEQLAHNVSGLQVEVVPQQLEKKGGS